MTYWIQPDTAFVGATKYDNLTMLARRINKAYSLPNTGGTRRMGVARQNTGAAIFYLALPDADYTDLVSKSSGTTGLSAAEQLAAVNVAPAGDANTTAVPLTAQGFVDKTVICIGDSLTNGVQVVHTTAEQLHAQFVAGQATATHVTDSNQRNHSYDRSNYHGFNFGADSYQVANPNAEPFGDWTTDFPKYLPHLRASGTLIFNIWLGTNDLSHETTIDPETELYTNRLVPLIALIKADYPTAKISFTKTIARGTTSTLNNRIISYCNAVSTNAPGNSVDAIADTHTVKGTGVWATVNILDPANPGVTVSRAAASTVSGIDTGTNVITTGTHSMITGTPVNVTSSGTMPGGVDNATPYYARVLSTTTFTLHPTLADAQANTNAVDITSSGSGTISVATSGDTYYSTDAVHLKPAATALVGAALKAALDGL